jgi:hypothetical protein
MIYWLKKLKTLISSLSIWNHEYEPYQVVILRSNHASDVHLIFYFQLNVGIVANQHNLGKIRTNTEEEINFHLARIGCEFLDNQRGSIAEDSVKSTDDFLKNNLTKVFYHQLQ